MKPNKTILETWWDQWPHGERVVLTAISAATKQIETCSFTYKAEKKGEFLAWVNQHNGSLQWNVYFTVCPTTGPVTKKPSKAEIKEAPWLWADVDPRAGEDFAAERERILKRLQEHNPKPTAILDSGGGFWGFWRLQAAVSCDDAERFNKQLALDLGADDCHNCDRIARLPGTVNWPDEKKAKKGRVPALAAIVEHEAARVYPASQFKQAPTPSTGKVNVDSANVARINDINDLPGISDLGKVVIVQGTDPDRPDRFSSRSEALFYVCCEMVRAGCGDDTIYSVITDPGFGISASVRDKGRGAEKYALRQIQRAHANNAAPDWVRELNREHAIIKAYGGRTRIIYERPDGSLEVMLRDDFKSFYEYDRVQIGTDAKGNAKYAPKGHAWFTHDAARRYDYVAFMPREDAPDNVYNLFRGWSVTPKEGDCEPFLDFVRWIVCDWNDDYFTYLMDWAAHLFQRPEEPGQVAVVLRGKQGIGKGYFAKTLGSLMGQHFHHIKSVRHLLGNFNAHLQNKLLVFGDEVFGTSEQSARGVLKAMITEETQDIEKKGVDVVREDRYFRVILSSNEGWAVPAELDDRRFFVLDVVHPLQEDAKAKSEYFDTLTDWADNGGRSYLLHHLLTRDISRFNHRLRPRTPALVAQQVMTLNGPQKVIYVGLRNGTLAAHKVDGQRIFVATRLLREQCGMKVEQETALGRELRKAADTCSKQETVDGKKVRGYWLPALPAARDNWAQANELPLYWPSDPDTWESVDADVEVPF